MRKRMILLILSGGLVLCICASVTRAEEMTITTYYPSPNGAYDALNVKRLSVGDTNGDGSINASDVSPSSGYLLVADKLGIGTAIPNDKLHVANTASISRGLLVTHGTGNADTDYSTVVGPRCITMRDGISFLPVYLASLWSNWFMYTPNGDIYLGRDYDGNIYGSVQTAGSTYLATNRGNVGIGTTAPITKLEVNSSSDVVWGSVARFLTPTLSEGNRAIIGIGKSSVNWQEAWIGYHYGNTSADRWLGFGHDGTWEQMVLTESGNVGIGTTSPNATLQVKGAILAGTDCYGDKGVEISSSCNDNFWIKTYSNAPNANFSIGIGNGSGGWASVPIFWNGFLALQKDGGNVGIGTTNPGSYKLYVNGSAYSTGTWGISDVRLKKNISRLNGVLNKLQHIRGVSFDWRSGRSSGKSLPKDRQIGLIAQEVEKEFPELVHTDNDGYKALAYDKVSAVLIEAIKEQQFQIEELKKEVRALRVKSTLRGK